MNTTAAKVPCPVCALPLAFRMARGRKSGKPFLLLICDRDGRHFRGFIADRNYLRRAMNTDQGTGA